jgi:hypothetical protein
MPNRVTLRLPAVTRANLWYCVIFAYLIFNALYLGAAIVAVQPAQVLVPTALDQAVPFVGASIWVYLSQFLLVPWAVATAGDDATRNRAFYSMLLATLLSLPVFVLYPTRVPHPLAPDDGLLGLAWCTLHLADTPNNAFPSLHVALATLAGITLWQRRRRLVAMVWPCVITISTLTTRQHVSWDIAGGLLVAALAWYLTPRLVP